MRGRVQESYSALNLRSSLSSFKLNYVKCWRFRLETIQPIMAEFPKKEWHTSPLHLLRPWVDYSDPFSIYVWTAEKIWLALFLVWLFAMSMLRTPHPWTLSRATGVEFFFSHRSTPAIFWSDKGSQFFGFEKELRENIE